jgi:hypothetical protein
MFIFELLYFFECLYRPSSNCLYHLCFLTAASPDNVPSGTQRPQGVCISHRLQVGCQSGHTGRFCRI